jgi:hypothetical protein
MIAGSCTVGLSSSHSTMEGAAPEFPFTGLTDFSPIPVTTAIAASGSGVMRTEATGKMRPALPLPAVELCARPGAGRTTQATATVSPKIAAALECRRRRPLNIPGKTGNCFTISSQTTISRLPHARMSVCILMFQTTLFITTNGGIVNDKVPDCQKPHHLTCSSNAVEKAMTSFQK